MKVKVTSKTQPRIKVNSKKERKIDPEEVAKKLGAEIKKEEKEDGMGSNPRRR